MTNKVYKSAMGKEIDLGALLLQNEHVRAVGNMNVNARGDKLDSGNQVIDTKNRQAQRQYKKTTNVSSSAVHTGTRAAKQQYVNQHPVTDTPDQASMASVAVAELKNEPVAQPAPVEPIDIPPTGGGLAAAIARSRIIKQEKELTARQKAQAKPISKI